MEKQFVVNIGGLHQRDDRLENVFEADKFCIQYCASPLNPITDGGRIHGAVLGHCLPTEGESSRACSSRPEFAGSIDFSNGLESLMACFHRKYCGRYVVIIEVGQDVWLFGDPVCGYPIVVDIETGRAASSARALFQSAAEYQQRLNASLTSITELDKDDWFPSGLTAHDAVERLLPNHAVRLSSADIRRVWPPRATVNGSDSVDSVASHMKRVAAAACEQAAHGGTLYLTATAGFDSRVALAACRDFAVDLTALTLATGGVEVDVAARLCEIAKAHHVTVQLKRASPAEQEEWRHRNGHCVGGANMRFFPTIGAAFSSSDVFVSGVGGEIGRAYYWSEKDIERNGIDADSLLLRMKLAPCSQSVKKTQQWLDGLAGLSLPQVLDLAYVEQRTGAWASPQFYGNVGHPVVFSPFCTGAFVEYCLTCPPQERLSNAVPRTLIAKLWPDLLEVPFNRHGDVRDLFLKIKQFRPSIIRRKVRKLVGSAR